MASNNGIHLRKLLNIYVHKVYLNMGVLLSSIIVNLYRVTNLSMGVLGAMTPAKKMNGKKISKYLFKITVVGPDDKLLMDVLSIFDDPVVSVDGIRIGSTEVDFDTSEVHAVFMSPRHSALDILLALTYKGASGVIIVLREPDPEIETLYRNEIRENLGTEIPTRVVTIGSTMDKFKRTEIEHMFDDVVGEILERKTKKGK